MGLVQRKVECSGSADIERVLRDVFAELAGGRLVPTEMTSFREEAYSEQTKEYRTPQGDGLVASECLDYGEFHHVWSYRIDIGESIAISAPDNWREPTFVFHLGATAELVDEVTATLVRIVTAAGLKILATRDA